MSKYTIVFVGKEVWILCTSLLESQSKIRDPWWIRLKSRLVQPPVANSGQSDTVDNSFSSPIKCIYVNKLRYASALGLLCKLQCGGGGGSDRWCTSGQESQKWYRKARREGTRWWVNGGHERGRGKAWEREEVERRERKHEWYILCSGQLVQSSVCLSACSQVQ